MQDDNTKPKGRWTLALLTFAAGMVAMVGIGLAVKGTDQAAFCASCHAMSEAAWTHKKSIHAQFDCNECHTPHAIAQKLPYKAAVGMHDIYVNTTSTIPDLIHTQQKMKDVIQENCLRCHVGTTMTVALVA